MASRVPISAADVATILEEQGLDQIVTVDVHAGQIAGFFSPRCPLDNLSVIPAAVRPPSLARTASDPHCTRGVGSLAHTAIAPATGALLLQPEPAQPRHHRAALDRRAESQGVP